nr:molybdopterin-dependent oxidoreductase [uncultured Rhodoferax sp.]
MIQTQSWLLRILVFLPLALHLPVASAEEADRDVLLTISGNFKKSASETEVTFTMAQLEKLPQLTFTTKTPWHTEAVTMTGPLLRDVLKEAGASGSKLVAVALNDYKVEIPFEDAQKYQVIVARLLNGKPMPVRAKGPLFIIYPFDALPELQTQKYYFRSAWQLHRIIVK